MPKGKTATEIIQDIIKASEGFNFDIPTIRMIIEFIMKDKGYSKQQIRKSLPHELKLRNRTNIRYRHLKSI